MSDTRCVFCSGPIETRQPVIEISGGMLEAEPGEPLIFVPLEDSMATAHSHTRCLERAFHLFNEHQEN